VPDTTTKAGTAPSVRNAQDDDAVVAAERAVKSVAAAAALADSGSGSQPKPSSLNERDRPDASTTGENTSESGGQSAPEKTATEASPGPTSTDSQVEKPSAAEPKAVVSTTAVAVLADTTPKPPPDRRTSVNRTVEKPADSADTVASSPTPSIKTSEPSPSPRPEATPPKPSPDDPIPDVKAAPSQTPPQKEQPEPSPAATIASLSAASDQGQVVPSGTEESQIDLLEDRLRSFLQLYCSTYAAKDLSNFATLFSDNAVENGKPFESLLPKYERNFKFIETIEYRIELLEFSYDEDEDMVQLEGDFFLKWLPPDNKWRENSGKISMDLQRKGATFLVQRLDYRGRGKKE
jgi:hypothetical protein